VATATGTVMIQKFTETLAQTIERSHAEATAANGWLVIYKNDGHIFLISDDIVRCHPDSVEFTDDNEVRIVLPYEQISLVEVGKG
jgi:hypothetical protein